MIFYFYMTPFFFSFMLSRCHEWGASLMMNIGNGWKLLSGGGSVAVFGHS
jgi:hypothetical protein